MTVLNGMKMKTGFEVCPHKFWDGTSFVPCGKRKKKKDKIKGNGGTPWILKMYFWRRKKS